PASGYGLTMAAVTGSNPNGPWNLYVQDFAGGDVGSFAGGWAVAITTNTGTAFVYNAATNPGITNYTLRVSGGNYQIVEKANLAPVNDLVAATNVTYNGTAAAEQINVVDGPVVAGTQTTQVNSGASGTFELVNFANKTNVTVAALAGVDTVTLNNANPAVG